MEEILQSTEIKWRFPIHQFRYMYNEIQTGFPGSARKIKQKKVYIYIIHQSTSWLCFMSPVASPEPRETFDIFDTADAFMAFITDGMYITDFA